MFLVYKNILPIYPLISGNLCFTVSQYFNSKYKPLIDKKKRISPLFALYSFDDQ